MTARGRLRYFDAMLDPAHFHRGNRTTSAPGVALAFMLCFGLQGCAENVDPSTPDGALHVLRAAIMKKNATAVLELCTAETRKQVTDLHGLLAAQSKIIGESYPEPQRVAARAAYPAGLLDAKSPETLFGALIERGLKDLPASEGLEFGMTAQGRPSIEGEQASVTSQAGEAYEFRLEGGEWKAQTFEREVSATINRARLFQQTIDENLNVIAELNRLEVARKARDAATSGSATPSAP